MPRARSRRFSSASVVSCWSASSICGRGGGVLRRPRSPPGAASRRGRPVAAARRRAGSARASAARRPAPPPAAGATPAAPRSAGRSTGPGRPATRRRSTSRSPADDSALLRGHADGDGAEELALVADGHGGLGVVDDREVVAVEGERRRLRGCRSRTPRRAACCRRAATRPRGRRPSPPRRSTPYAGARPRTRMRRRCAPRTRTAPRTASRDSRRPPGSPAAARGRGSAGTRARRWPRRSADSSGALAVPDRRPDADHEPDVDQRDEHGERAEDDRPVDDDVDLVQAVLQDRDGDRGPEEQQREAGDDRRDGRADPDAGG